MYFNLLLETNTKKKYLYLINGINTIFNEKCVNTKNLSGDILKKNTFKLYLYLSPRI